jgi:TonB family protein
MGKPSLSQLYFEGVRVSKMPLVWFVCAGVVHAGLLCVPTPNYKPARQGIVFDEGNAGIQVDLLPEESAQSSADQPVVSPDRSDNITEPPRAESVQAVAETVSSEPHRAKAKRGTQQTVAKAPRAGTAAAQPASQVFTTQPPYPPEARELGIEGAVRLRVRVGVDGSPRAVEILRSSGRSDFDLASLDTIRREWRFRPARTADGSAVESTIVVAIQFTLKS